ncbi:MAG: L-glutamate gamma-semialdehyde dehydrogenase [Planctomycetes bacterium]|nr:L-glutamate gamma-semialdehyde dehydrogenase [Planctomycetota bacterium]
MTLDARVKIPEPRNEPVLSYAPGSPERAEIKKALKAVSTEKIEIPLVIGGKEVRTGRTANQVMPHDHKRILATVHLADRTHLETAIRAAVEAQASWAAMAFEDRAAIFLRAAELLAGPRRWVASAATMANQSKTVHQAEIDAACELIDFWRYNPYYAQEIYSQQPLSAPGVWNYLEFRPLEGFVLAVTPFNFTSIQGNLPTSPAILGNVCLWKPASSAIHSAWHIFKVLEEAGLPPGVINFVPCSGKDVGSTAIASEHLAGVHFTGSTDTFHDIWRRVAENLPRYKGYPRLVGETGGKDFVFAHPSADIEALVTALVRGAYEYQGQKCSAASRAYFPASIWGRLKERLVETIRSIRMGDPADFTNFMGAVIDKKSYDSIKSYTDLALSDRACQVLAGGKCDDSMGYFIQPTLVQSTDPRHRLMKEEIFGPVLTVFVYEDARIEEALDLCDTASPYALTGSVFARDRAAIAHIRSRLRHTAGNFYINDKPTGAVVGQQPFGGARASGTNDKAGSVLNLLRWASARTIKETFVPPRDYRYPFLEPD